MLGVRFRGRDVFLNSIKQPSLNTIKSWTSIVEENGSWIDKNTEENMDAMYQNFAAGMLV